MKVMTRRVNKDNWYHHLRCTDVTKIPIYNNLEQVGDEPGMEGNIILRRDTQEFCYHDGTTWICLSGSGGGDVTLADACGGDIDLVVDGVGPNLVIKGLNEGTGITLQDDGSCVTIINNSPAGSVTLSNVCPTDTCTTGETRQTFFKLAGGTSGDEGASISAIVTGGCDCAYVTGLITTTGGNNPVDFNGNIVSGFGSQDIFVAKLNNDGSQAFFKVAGGSGADNGNSVSAIVNGANDCVYVTGFIDTTSSPPAVDFDGNTITGIGLGDIFVAKLASDGTQVFFKVAGGLFSDAGNSVSAIVNGANDCVYVTGVIETSGGSNPVDFDGNTITGFAGQDIFVAKLASDGTQAFFKVAGGSDNDGGRSVSAIVNGANDCVYVTGFIDNDGSPLIDFDGNTITGIGDVDIFVAKLASDGTQVFFKVAGGVDSDVGISASAIVNAGSDCVYVTGAINTTSSPPAVDFDGNTVTGFGERDIFVAKLASDGSQVFFKVAGGTLRDEGRWASAIVNGGSDCVYVTGFINTSGSAVDFDGNTITGFGDRDIFVAKLASDGSQVFFKVAGGSLIDEGASVSAIVNGGSDCVYVTGRIDTSVSTVDFDGNTISGFGNDDIFIAKLTSDGTQAFFKIAGGSNDDRGVQVSAVVNGTKECAYVTGFIDNDGAPLRDFDGNIVSGFGGLDIFVAKLTTPIGVSLVAGGLGPDLTIKGLIGGPGITLTDDGSCVEIAIAGCTTISNLTTTFTTNPPPASDGSITIANGNVPTGPEISEAIRELTDKVNAIVTVLSGLGIIV